MAVQVRKVGHVVLRVEDVERSLGFYRDALGLTDVARRDFGEGPMVFLSSGASHHDIALVETGERVSPGSLHHLALKIGDGLDELSEAKQALLDAGVEVHMALDHHVSHGLYVSDPDGNLVELYVDADESIWRTDPTEVAHSDPLTI